MSHLAKHMPALDGLRGVAILLVVLTHVGVGWNGLDDIYSGSATLPKMLHLPIWLLQIAEQGEFGVVLFFVISAFTLTVRSREWREDLTGYGLRRIARVGPGYWLAGICYTLYAGLTPRFLAPHGVSLTDLAVTALFGTAWQGGAAFAVVPGGWSVSVEISFYIALPFVLRMIDGQIRRSVMAIVVALVLVEIWSVYIKLAYGWTFFAYANPINHAPVFLMGITAALIAMRYRLPNRPDLVVACLAFAILALPFMRVTGLLPQLPFAVVVAVAAAFSAAHPPRFLANRLLCRIGEVSYSIYLVHFAVLPGSLLLAEWVLPASDWRTMVLHYMVTVVVSFGISCATYTYIEQPPIRWMSRWLKKRRPALIESATG
jgi:peptidoglycan/LPS O-acetylase OafA/YrhL